MFRPIRRTKRAISDEAAKALLKSSRRGVLAVNGDDGYPYAVPVNYLYDEMSNAILFHGAKAGHKFDSLKASDKVCFTVFGNETVKEEEAWAPYVQSVVVFGRCEMVENLEDSLELVKKLAMKYYPNEQLADDEISKDGKAVQMFRINIEHLSGKQIQEK